MLEYITTGIVRINGGTIGLSRQQAGVRRNQVRPVKGEAGVYDILAPIELKAGETIRLADPDKGLRKDLVLSPAEKARQEAAEAQARKEAEAEHVRQLAASERHGAIMTAARQAVKGGLVTAVGAPSVKAMEDVAGFDISSEERDAAWAEIQNETVRPQE